MNISRRTYLRKLGRIGIAASFSGGLIAQKQEGVSSPLKSTVLALQGFMDTETELRVRAAWQRLAESGITDRLLRGGSRPHVTLGSWSITQEPDELIEKLLAAARRLGHIETTLKLNLNQPEQKGVYLLPEADDQALFDFHAKVHRLFGTPGEPFREKDLPGQWWPHLSVAYGFDSGRLEEAFHLCSDLESVRARIEYLGLVTFGPIRYPAVFRLSG